MSSVITEETIRRSENRRMMVRKGEDIKKGREELHLDPKLVMNLFQRPVVEVRKDIATARIYITGMALVPINLEEIIALEGPNSIPHLHLELVEHSEVIMESTLANTSSKAVNALMKSKLDRMRFYFTRMDNVVWGGNKGAAVSMEFKIFRSKLAVELKKKYGLKNL